MTERVRDTSARRALGLAVLTLGLVAAAGCTWETADEAEDEAPATTQAPTTTVAEPDEADTSDAADQSQLDGLELRLAMVAEEIDRPVDLAFAPGSRDLWIASKGGEITKILARESRTDVITYELDWRPTLDLTEIVEDGSNEQGLLGIAIPRGGRFLFTSSTDAEGALVVDRYEISSTRTTIDEETRKRIIRIEQPAANHNGGAIRFGPDGYLYVGLGDGGGSGDPDGHGQDTSTLLGSVLRLEVDTDQPYEIPQGNPFIDSGDAAPEIHLYGVRNPWRFAFDRETGDLWLADVGQDRWEEINWLPAASGTGRAANLGWNEMEGTEPFGGGSEPDDAVAPVHTYGREAGCSVTGGFVYRGSAIPELVGTYLFGDYCDGGIQGLVLDDGEVVDVRSLGIGIVEESLGSFGEGPDGEIYVLSLEEGRVLRIEPALRDGSDTDSDDEPDEE